MTATASTEIDVLDFEPAGSGSPWMREVGDLQLANWEGPRVEDVSSLDDLGETRRDTVMVVAGFPSEEWPAEQAGVRTLTLPRAVLVAAGCDANIPACLVLEQDRPLVGVLVTVLDEVWSRVPAMNASEVEATRGVLVTLTAGVIRAESRSASPRSGLSGLRAKIEDWINDNLRSGPIHVETLAAAHNVSARTVHRAFSLTGDTMTAVVRARRLAAVREDLVHTDMTVATIAHRWSYYDPSHLGREFRRRFGVSPSEYRDSHGC
ncbi:helix-turn-helix transcriptional regulator [Nocardioides sp. CPCC 206347]|uniref:AraC family transcriptional regulator n=1 Tax=Nocardioides sp. CPCC 206347 TaxID=3406463 RepID=UPI003B42C8D8